MNPCARKEDGAFQGYAEGKFVRFAAPLTSRLEELSVVRGERIVPGDPPFALERGFETAMVAD